MTRAKLLSVTTGAKIPASVRPLAQDLDDEALVEGLVSADPHARAACYDRYAPRIERVLYRTLGRDDEIEDALQETFEVAFRDAGKIRDPARLGAWLRSVAIFVARGMLRKRRRRWLRFLDPINLPEAAVEGTQRATHDWGVVHRILEKMPEEERIALVLRRLERLEVAEIAEAMDLSVSTVKRRIQNAQVRFNELVAQEPNLAHRLEQR